MSTTPVHLAQSGQNVPDTNAETIPWTGPNLICTDDSSYASITAFAATSHGLKALNPGFVLPNGAIIDGIEVTVSLQLTADSVSVQLVKAGILVGSPISLTPSGSSEVLTFGGDANLFGTTWSELDLESQSFGCVLTATAEGVLSGTVNYIGFKPYFTVNNTITAALTTPAAGMSAAGTFTIPNRTASSAVQTRPATLAAAVTARGPLTTASAALLVGPITIAATAETTLPQYTGTSNVTIGSVYLVTIPGRNHLLTAAVAASL